MKLLLILLAKIFNSLPKTDFILVHWCRLYESYGLESPNLVGMNDAPTVTSTSPATNILTTTATASGNITATGGENPSTRGVCYVAGTGTPTLSDTVNSESGSFGTGAFSRNLTSLSPGTLYTFRAFATNSVGTSFGANVQFTTASPPFAGTQAEAAFYEDGTEAGATVISAGADSITRDVSAGDSNLQLRVRLQETGGGAGGLSTDDYQLQYELNDSGTWQDTGTYIQDSYPEANQTSGYSSHSLTYAEQSFTASKSANLTSAKFYLQKIGAPTGTFTAVLYSHSGTYGTSSARNTLLATSDSVNVTTIATGSYALYEFVFSGGNQYAMTSGTQYMIGLDYTSLTDDASNRVLWGADFTSPTHGGNINTNTGGSNTEDFIFYVLSSGAAPVLGFNSASLTDGNATTNRLGAGSGSFVAGEISEDGLVDNLAITASNYTELLYSLTIESTAVADTDTLDFRVLRNGATTGMTYTVVPRITIEATAGDAHTLVTQDSTLSLSIDNTTITQNHVIQPQDIALSLTEDSTTIAQNHVVATQDIALALTTDNTTVNETHILAVQDIALSLTEDNTTLAQNHVVATQDIALALTTDNTTISQNHIIASNDVALSLTEDNATITQNHVLPVADIALSLSEDNTTVTETNFNLVAQDIALTLTEDATTINQNHVIASNDIALALSEDNTTISQNHVVSAQDITLSLSEDNATVDQTNFVLTTQDIALALTEDNTTITQNHLLTAQDIALALSEDNTSITQNHIVITQDIALALSTDNTTVEEEAETVLIVQDVALALSEDATTITQIHALTTQDIALALTEDNTTISQNHVVSAQDIALSLTTDNATLSQNHIVVTQDMLLSLTEDNTTIAETNFVLMVQDILLALSTDNTTITQIHSLTAQDILLSLSLDNTTVSVQGAGTTNGFTYFDGNTWTVKPVKYYNGVTWTAATLKRYNGATWVDVTH